MKKDSNTPLTDEYLESLANIRPVAPKAFFYERIVDRLADSQQASAWPVKPTWMIASLTILLLLNTFLLIKNNHISSKDAPATIESFAAAYDLQISNY